MQNFGISIYVPWSTYQSSFIGTIRDKSLDSREIWKIWGTVFRKGVVWKATGNSDLRIIKLTIFFIKLIVLPIPLQLTHTVVWSMHIMYVEFQNCACTCIEMAGSNTSRNIIICCIKVWRSSYVPSNQLKSKGWTVFHKAKDINFEILKIKNGSLWNGTIHKSNHKMGSKMKNWTKNIY